MSCTKVQISQHSHIILKQLVKHRRAHGERANNGMLVEQLILAEARREKIDIKKILSTAIPG